MGWRSSRTPSPAGRDRPARDRSAPTTPASAWTARALQLQALAGNRAVAALLGPATAQRDNGAQPAAANAPAGGAGAATDVATELVNATVGLSEQGQTLLQPTDVRTALEARSEDPALAAAVERLVADIGQRAPEEGPIAPLRTGADVLLRLLERRFILDPAQSTLDLLPRDRGDRYRSFKWDRNDFPGPPAGPNEERAKRMIGDLASILPERRPNSTEAAVISEREANSDVKRRIVDEMVPVEGQPPHRLNRHAAASFAEMHAAAAAEGVDLHIDDADRSFARAAARAASAGNPAAVGGFSSHTLGLAVDLRMSAGRQRFREEATRPFQNVVDMHESPAHKWMFLRGSSYGWYPFQHEPWHWEYNPPGFRETFREAIGLARPYTGPTEVPAPVTAGAPSSGGG